MIAAAARVVCERLEVRTLLSVAGADTFTTNAGAPVVITGPSLLANDTDLGAVSGVTEPANGTVTTNPDGSFTYMPNPGFAGTDSFNYVGQGGSAAVVDFQSLDAQGRAHSLGQVSVGSFQFGVGRGIGGPTGSSKDREASAPSFSEMSFSSQMNAASPKLLGTVGTGGTVDRAVVTTYDAAGRVSDVWTLKGVHVTGDSLSTGGDLPSESFSLSYGDILYQHTDRTGGNVKVTSAGYDLVAGKATATAAFVASDLSKNPPRLELSFGNKIDLAIGSLGWGVGRAAPAPGAGAGGGSTTGQASISELSVTADESAESAALLSAAVVGDPMDNVTLTSRDSDGNVVAAWTLQGVLLSGFSLSGTPGGTSTSFTLNYTQITETYNQLDSNGQVAATASNSYDVGTVSPNGPSDFGKRKVTASTLLDFETANGGDLGQVELGSYQWGVGRGIGSPVPDGVKRTLLPPSVSEFTLSTEMSIASPELFAAVTAGSPIDHVVLTHTQTINRAPVAVTTWTLHDVVVTGDSLSSGGGGPTSESFSLAFDAFGYDFQKLDGKGNVTAHTTTGYDLRTDQVVLDPMLGGGTKVAPGPSQLLLHLGPGADVVLNSAQFGMGNGSDPSGQTPPVPPSLSDIVVTTQAGVQSAGILTTLLQGTVIPDATLTRTDASGQVVAEWDLQNVLLSGYSISAAGGGAAGESFNLSPDAVTVTIPETDATRATGTGSTSWDFGDRKGSASPDFGGAKLAIGPGGLMEVHLRDQVSQVALGSFQFGAGNPAGVAGAAVHSPITATALLSGVSLGVFAAVADGQHADSVVIAKRDPQGALIETLTLTDVAFQSYSTSITGGGGGDSFDLAYGALEFAFYPPGTADSPITTPTGGWDIRPSTPAAQRSAAGATTNTAAATPTPTPTPFGGSDLSKNPPSLLASFGPGGDVAANSFQFGAGAGAPKAHLSEFTLPPSSGLESAALLSAVENGTRVPDVTVAYRDANEKVVAEWDLHDVLVTGYAQSDGGGGGLPSESFTLSAGKVTETFFPRDATGKSIGPPAATTWDVAKNQFTVPADFGGQPVAGAATGVVTVNVLPVNNPPTAAPVTAATFQNGPTVTVPFAGADADAGDTLTYTIVTPLAPGQGGVVLNGDGTFTFDPGADFNDLGEGDARAVSFTYQATDNHGAASDPATVTIAVSGVNHAPSFVAGPSQLLTDHAGPQMLPNWAFGIVAGPGSEPATQTLHFIVSTNNPGLFTVAPAIDPAGNLTFTPVGTGLAHVTVLLQDDGGTDHGGSDTSPAAQFDIGVVDPPVHVAGRPVAVVEGVPLASAVFAMLTDEDPQATLADYTATIDFGDGSVVPATVVADPSGPGRFLVLGSTTYAEEGSAVARVIVRDAGGSSDATTTTVTIADAPLTATAVHVAATAGAPFDGPVATFTDGNPAAPLTDFTATIAWGDGTVTPGVITRTGAGTFSIAGSHVYAAAGTYATKVMIADVGGSTAQTADNSAVTSLARPIRSDQVNGQGFWHAKPGQALINSFNGGPSSTALGNWLAATLPNLFGPGAGANNMANATNARVAALYLSLFGQHPPRLEAEILATALNVYATTASLGGQAARSQGFFIDQFGLGASTFSIGSNGALLGLPNSASVTVYQVLRAADARVSGGALFAGNDGLRRQANDLFDAINSGEA